MKTFKFDREGLKKSQQYKNYTEIAKETLENNPQLFPLVLTLVVIGAAIICSPGASAVAYKSSIYDSGMIAFKYLSSL